MRRGRSHVVEAVTDLVQVMQKFPRKPAIVVFNSYYFSTASLNTLNPLISFTVYESPGSVVKTKIIGAVREDCLPVIDCTWPHKHGGVDYCVISITNTTLQCDDM